MVQTCDPDTPEAEAGELFQAWGQAGIHSKTLSQETNKQQQKQQEKNINDVWLNN